MKTNNHQDDMWDGSDRFVTAEELRSIQDNCLENECAPRFTSDGIGFLTQEFAELPARALIDTKRLAHTLDVTTDTLRRMVRRGELPPPIRLARRSTWFVGRVLAHIEAAADRAELRSNRQALLDTLGARSRRLTPRTT